MPNRLFTPRIIALTCMTALCASPVMAQNSATSAVATPAQAATTPTPAAVTTDTERAALLEDIGSAERIQRAGSLRMLSQRISASVCNRAAGIAVADADKYLDRAVRDYRRIIVGLVEGDDGLGLYGPESDRLVLRDVGKLQTLWSPLDETFDTVAKDELTREHAVQIAQTAPEMMHIAEELVGAVVAEYSDPAQMLQSDAVLLQIAERQRMLEQEIANATCMIADGIDVEEARAMMIEAIRLYEVSLAALRTGMPEAGVAAPPTKAIDLWLGDIDVRWNAVRPTLDLIGAGGDVSTEDRTLVYEEMNKLTWMMNVTVGQYTEASKLKY